MTGLTGLLAKDAAVTVRYTAGDLDKAGGDASKLHLARWDVGSQWTVLKTSVNSGAMTLTANSNQMSIWAVVVGSSAGGADWLMPVVIVVIVMVVAGVVILFLARRTRQAKPVT